MAATERMRAYAITIACTLGIPFPNFLDYNETSEFISAHVGEYKAVPSRKKTEMKPEILSWIYAAFDIDSHKLKMATGNWLKDMFGAKTPPFDSLENLNAADRLDLAKQFWEWKTEPASGWKHIRFYNGVAVTNDELMLIIAKDLDYRIPKAAANYFFHKTKLPAGSVIIDPSAAPYNTVRLQFEETYHCLYKESHSYQHGKPEFREWVDGDGDK